MRTLHSFYSSHSFILSLFQNLLLSLTPYPPSSLSRTLLSRGLFFLTQFPPRIHFYSSCLSLPHTPSSSLSLIHLRLCRSFSCPCLSICHSVPLTKSQSLSLLLAYIVACCLFVVLVRCSYYTLLCPPPVLQFSSSRVSLLAWQVNALVIMIMVHLNACA